MLNGRDGGPSLLPAGDRGDHPARRACRQGSAAAHRAAGSVQDGGRQAQVRHARQAGRGLRRDRRSWPASRRSARSRTRPRSCSRATRKRLAAFGEQFGNLEAEVVRNAILDTGKRIDGRDTKTVRPIVAEVGVLPRAHGSALFTRGETQALVVATLGTGQDEQIIDALEGEYREALHDALQLASLRGRRSAPHGLARPPRDRPRQARLARAAPDAARQGQVPLHDPHRVGDHREQRLVLDGLGLRRLAGADGCGRADGPAGGRHRHGPDQGRRALRRPVRHPGRRGSPRRHGLQGRRHRAAASPRCRWTSRSPRSTRRSCRWRWARPRTAACTSWARWPRAWAARARASARTRRASPSSRSRRTRSAK